MTQVTSTLPYSIPELDLANLYNIYTHLRVTVVGFWSDVVTIIIKRTGYDYTKPADWMFTITHSSGGYDDVVDNLTANENFALANLAAVKFCREWQEKKDVLEKAFVANNEVAMAKFLEEQRLRQEKIDADPAIGTAVATATVNKMIEDCAANKTAYVTASVRGEEGLIRTFRCFWKNGKTNIMFDKNDVNKKGAINFLSDLSMASMKYTYE